MAFGIEAFAGDEALLRKHGAMFSNAHVIPLAQGIALLPLTVELMEEIDPSAIEGVGVHGFQLLSTGVAKWAATISQEGPVAYFEAAYVGGWGEQYAMVWKGGTLAAGPLSGPAINRALGMLGVQRVSADDEFDTVGLGKYRETEEWVARAIAEKEERGRESN